MIRVSNENITVWKITACCQYIQSINALVHCTCTCSLWIKFRLVAPHFLASVRRCYYLKNNGISFFPPFFCIELCGNFSSSHFFKIKIIKYASTTLYMYTIEKQQADWTSIYIICDILGVIILQFAESRWQLLTLYLISTYFILHVIHCIDVKAESQNHVEIGKVGWKQPSYIVINSAFWCSIVG